MATATQSHTTVCLALTRAISKCRTVEDIYEAALDALAAGLGVERSSILLFDPDGVMRFKAFRGLSEAYRRAVEGHTPWRPDSPDPQPIVVSDVRQDASLASFGPVFQSEGIVGDDVHPARQPRPGHRQVHAVLRDAADARRRRAGAGRASSRRKSRSRWSARGPRNRPAAARSGSASRSTRPSMGTWDWDLATNTVHWSDNLERIHGLPPGAFDGTFASYEREIHPEDRDRVLASVQRALSEGVPHDVEYRIVAPDGTVRWCEGKGRVDTRTASPCA